MPSCRFSEGNKRFAFIHIQKCAGTAISRAVTVRTQTPMTNKSKKHKPDKHADIYALREKYGELGFTFTCVRNPWERMVSAYHYYRKQKRNAQPGITASFSEWILDHDWGTMKKLQGDYFDEVDFLIRYENLADDWETLRTVHKVPLDTLRRRNTSNHNFYRTYYDDDTVEKVRGHFKDDIERFGYEY